VHFASWTSSIGFKTPNSPAPTPKKSKCIAHGFSTNGIKELNCHGRQSFPILAQAPTLPDFAYPNNQDVLRQLYIGVGTWDVTLSPPVAWTVECCLRSLETFTRHSCFINLIAHHLLISIFSPAACLRIFELATPEAFLHVMYNTIVAYCSSIYHIVHLSGLYKLPDIFDYLEYLYHS
jgi:hypothetical protein